MSADAVIWHDLECGGYAADLAVWAGLAAEHRGPLLDVGAGTGRVALALAREGHEVIALERDGVLAAALAARAAGLRVEVLVADACAFALRVPVDLVIVPMQTIHLLEDRDGFLRCARNALRDGGTLAVSLLGEGVEPFELELDADAIELGGVRYESAPTALRRDADGIVLERRRSRIGASGPASCARDRVRLRQLDADALAAAARAHGLAHRDRLRVAPTREHAGSEIVLLEASP